MDERRAVLLGLAAFELHRTPGAVAKAIRERGSSGLEHDFAALPEGIKTRLETQAVTLEERGVGVLFAGEDRYPSGLIHRGQTFAPVLFHLGNPALLAMPGVGMCGARNVTDLGLKAARACGHEVSERRLAVISGYARGVDTETHLAALQSGGSTIIVLAEGIEHFRVKKVFREDYAVSRVLVLSQFPPAQPWGAYAAMARNRIIYGLGRALVVIEAGEKGGTLAAGEGALKLGRPVFVLDFGDATPPGNRMLLEKGATPVTSRTELGDALDALATSGHEPPAPQPPLF